MLPSVKDIGENYAKWEKYEIKTKTFELRPFEKPDMSPYLIHMTNEDSLLNILKSSKLVATTPSQSMSDWYNEKIVCFTESPTFAIDFFRYKAYKRWKDDLRFGIGFSKLKLAHKGVRPALYVDRSELISSIIKSKRILIKEDKESNVTTILKEIVDQVTPFMTPLDHNRDKQGFLWEREWRYANEDFCFDIGDIEIICCPRKHRNQITENLGVEGSHIKFIETWAEYDEVSTYLTEFQQHQIIQAKIDELSLKESYSLDDQINGELEKLKLYETQLESMLSKITDVKEIIQILETRRVNILERIELEKEKQCVHCANDFEDCNGIGYRNWNEDGHLCSNCKAEMHYKINMDD